MWRFVPAQEGTMGTDGENPIQHRTQFDPFIALYTSGEIRQGDDADHAVCHIHDRCGDLLPEVCPTIL